MKKCYKCGVTKTISNFGKCKRSSSGHQSICKECKREYDKSRASILYEKFKVTRLEVMLKISSCCEVCFKATERGFHLHHKEYHETESAYPKHSKAMNVRIKRVKEAEKNPERFAILCPRCHSVVEFLKSSSISLEQLQKFL